MSLSSLTNRGRTTKRPGEVPTHLIALSVRSSRGRINNVDEEELILGQIDALDSSPEMHEQSRKKIRDERVRYIERDVFSWEPDDTYDVVFFANWLSHVPPSAFEQFWAIVERALAPEGRVFFVDEVGDAWRNEDLREEFVQGPTVPIVRRPLKDGRTFDVVKVFWEPTELKARLAELGWDINVETSGPFFCAQGHR